MGMKIFTINREYKSLIIKIFFINLIYVQLILINTFFQGNSHQYCINWSKHLFDEVRIDNNGKNGN